MNKIFLTVDVECHNIKQKNLYIDGKIGNSYWGVRKILEIGKEKDIPINFFVDIPECHEYGDGFIEEIITLIHSYGQKCYLHIHPNFLIQGGYHYFWQYTREEQKEILQKSISDFERLTGYKSKAIRTGGYCNDQTYYEVLDEVSGGDMIDVTHCTDYVNSHYQSPTVNKMHYHGAVPVLPNTRFICLKLFGIRKHANLDVVSANHNEVRRILKHKERDNMICTMHSWNLLWHLFYLPWTMHPDYHNCRKMKKLIDCAKNEGWVFSNFEEPLQDRGTDCNIDLCDSVKGRILGCINTFFRMQRAARTNKKYFAVYAVFYIMVLFILVGFMFLF